MIFIGHYDAIFGYGNTLRSAAAMSSKFMDDCSSKTIEQIIDEKRRNPSNHNDWIVYESDLFSNKSLDNLDGRDIISLLSYAEKRGLAEHVL